MHIARRVSLYVLLGFLAPEALAQDKALQFNVPTQPLAAALDSVGRQANLQIIYNPDTLGAKAPRGIVGTYTPREAIDKLLAGTGLTYTFTAEDTVAMRSGEQQPPPPKSAREPASKPDDPTVLPEMTVTASPTDDKSYNPPNATTATKTDTPIMETPFSIQVVPQQVLRDQQVVRIEKAVENVSGVTTVGNLIGNNPLFTIRGFLNSDSETWLNYRDGVRSGGFSGSFPDLANIERIEVLKGPAAILYGRIEPGGLINQVTKKPLATPYYALEQQFGSFDFYRTTVDATGPLTKDNALLYRFNLAYEDAESFREFQESNRVFVAPALQWNLSDKTQVNLWLVYLNSNDPWVEVVPSLGNRPAPIPRERYLGEAGEGIDVETIRFGLNWSHAFNDRWTLRHVFDADFNSNFQNPHVTAFVNLDPASCSRAGGCPTPRFVEGHLGEPTHNESYFTSLDLTGKFESVGLKHTLLLGGDYWRSGFTTEGNAFFSGDAPPVDLFNPVHTGLDFPAFQEAVGNAVFGTEDSSSSQDWYGLYFQDQIALPFGLQVLGGFRYDKVTGHNDETDTDTIDEDAVTPRVGLLWQPIPSVSLYGNYVENFGATGVRNPEQDPLPPQTAQQWEVGVKTELFDGRLTATLAWYDLTKQNVAVVDPDPLRALRGLVVVPLGEANNRGLEFDLAGQILPGWDVIASYSYIDSEITKDRGQDFDPVTGAVTGANPGNTGNRLAAVPRHAGSLWTSYEVQAGALSGLKLGAGTLFRSQQELNNENTVQAPGYGLVNLLAGYGWRVGRSKVSHQLNIDNVLDKEYFVTSGGTGGTFGLSHPGAPRTFLGSVRVEF